MEIYPDCNICDRSDRVLKLYAESQWNIITHRSGTNLYSLLSVPLQVK